MEEIQLPNQERIWTVGKKEIWQVFEHTVNWNHKTGWDEIKTPDEQEN